jgi:hypothetical protein
MYKEYFQNTNIFDKNGSVIPFGWSKMPVFNYNKFDSAVSSVRLREIDTYCIKNSSVCMTISISSLGLYGIVSGTIIDFSSYKMGKNTVRKLLPFIKFKMPISTLSGDVAYNDSRIGVKFSKAGNKRYLKCDFLDFDNNKNLYFNIEIDEDDTESMNVAFPISHSQTSFFHKRFLPEMTAKGIIRFGGNEYNLDKERTTAFLDWTRASLPYKAQYQEVISQGIFKNSEMTIHFSSGVCENAEGIENCIFVDGKVIKLDKVKARGRNSDPKSHWIFKDKEEKIYLEFIPSTKGGGHLNASNHRQTIVYGNMYGHIIDKNKKAITIDGFDTLMIKSTL